MYCDALDAVLLPFAESEVGYTIILEDDHASTYRAEYTRYCLDSNDVYTLPWPVNTPDLNSLQSLWGILAREVYKNNQQFILWKIWKSL